MTTLAVPQRIPTIQQAIDAAQPGDCIRIGPGTYEEQLTIPARLSGLCLVGEGHSRTEIRLNRAFTNNQDPPQQQALPVLTNLASDVRIEGLYLHNCADEVDGSGGPSVGGKWDFALWNQGDRVVISGCRLRGDHDTLLLYSTANGYSTPGRVYVVDSRVEGRGDFIASFGWVYMERCTLARTSDNGHFLYQDSVSGGQQVLALRGCVLSGQTQSVADPFGTTNLANYARVYLIDTELRDGIGTNRPVAHFHEQAQAASGFVRYHNLTSSGTLSLTLYSYPQGNGRATADATGVVSGLTQAEADAITPLAVLSGWDPRAATACRCPNTPATPQSTPGRSMAAATVPTSATRAGRTAAIRSRR